MIQNKVLVTLNIFLVTALSANTLYKHNGKSVELGHLDPALRQAHYEAEKARYDALVDIAERDAYRRHVQGLADKQKKSFEDIEGTLFSASATDTEAKKWFDENKHRLGGRDFEKIKGEIKTFLSYRLKEEGRHTIIKKLKDENKFSITLKAPERPKFKINTTGYPTKGPKDAKVHIVEFADYQCPHCERAGQALQEVMKQFPKDVRLTFMDFPINRSGVSRTVAEGAACAFSQNKYWEYHEEAFDNQKSLTKDSPLELAKKLKLNESQWQKCMDDGKGKTLVDSAQSEGERLGITGTPAIYINGIKVSGYEKSALEEEIRKALDTNA